MHIYTHNSLPIISNDPIFPEAYLVGDPDYKLPGP